MEKQKRLERKILALVNELEDQYVDGAEVQSLCIFWDYKHHITSEVHFQQEGAEIVIETDLINRNFKK